MPSLHTRADRQFAVAVRAEAAPADHPRRRLRAGWRHSGMPVRRALPPCGVAVPGAGADPCRHRSRSSRRLPFRVGFCGSSPATSRCMTLLKLEEVRVQFRRDAGLFARVSGGAPRIVQAVDGVDLEVGEAETVALVGESGSGKTTTGRTVNLLQRPSSGRIKFQERDVTALEGEALRAHRRAVQMVFQNPFDALDPRLSIGVSVTEPLRLHGIGTLRERAAEADRMLAAVDLSPAIFRDRTPADLSGGQLQRASIARALVLSPRLVVADEPVSMLDVSVRAGVINLMLDL